MPDGIARSRAKREHRAATDHIDIHGFLSQKRNNQPQSDCDSGSATHFCDDSRLHSCFLLDQNPRISDGPWAGFNAPFCRRTLGSRSISIGTDTGRSF